MLLSVVAAVGLAASPVSERLTNAAGLLLPGEADAAAVVDLSTGLLVLTHHPAVLSRSFPPGSVFKLVSTYAALGAGIDPSKVERCSGVATIAKERRTCWTSEGHGAVDLARALADSCNLYFNHLGTKLQPEAFLSAARDLGFGRATGSGLEGEEEGELPVALTAQELITLAAGDGYQARATPLQLLALTAAIAGRGHAKSLKVDAAQVGRSGMRMTNGAAVDFLREAMRQAAETGTLGTTQLATVNGAGKTGTARWEHGFRTHAWFVGFAPFAEPKYAVVVFADNGKGAVEAAQPGVALLRVALGFEADPMPVPAPFGQLKVRVLEKARPDRAVINSQDGQLRCDGRPLRRQSARLEIYSGLIDLGGPNLRCRELVAPGEGVELEVNGKRRRFHGAISASVRDGQLMFVNQVRTEEYLRGVVGGEQLAGLPAALEAQAVVSRTYAFAGRGRHQQAGYDLCDLTHCQLYRGRDDERAESDHAVVATHGQVVRHQGKVEPTFFHSTCGGGTSTPSDVFKEDFALPAIADVGPDKKPLCGDSPHFRWSWTVSRSQLAAALGVPETGPAFLPRRRDSQGTVLELESFGVPLSGNAFQARVGRALGFQKLKSMKVRATQRGGQVLFEGNGLGHGVGLCQYGARALARAGYDYRKILRHYFPGGALGPLD